MISLDWVNDPKQGEGEGENKKESILASSFCNLAEKNDFASFF